MKNSKFIKFSILGLLPVIMTVGVISARQETPKVNAYTNYTESNLPTTIDLNDLSDNEVRSYYSVLNDKGESELKGTNLLKNLKPILSNGQKYFSYDSTSPKNAIWKAYEITDRDWELSPKEEIPGYNASENKIYGYQYKASTSFNDPKNPYVHALYVNREMDNPMKAWGNHNQTYGGINQEHIWAKSHGFETAGTGGARGDLMHLWAGDGIANRIHNNYVFGYVNKSNKNSLTIPTNDYAKESMLGPSLTLGGDKMVFEPQDSDKGDIARAIFYMAARYNNYAGAQGGIDSNEPNLIVDDIAYSSIIKGYQSTANSPAKYGVLSDLLEWNKIDPVDEYEIHRNNLLFKNFTFNRNPFIDFPSWADYIWDKEATGNANPKADPISRNEPVVEKTIDHIEIASLPYKIEFAKNENFSSEGLKVNAVYTDETKSEVKGFTVSKKGSLTDLGEHTITVTYHEKKATYRIRVLEGQVFTMKILPIDFNGRKYADNNGAHKSIAKSSIHEYFDEEIEWTSYQVMRQSGGIQFQKNAGYLFNTTNIGKISCVTVNTMQGSFSTFYGAEQQPTSGNDLTGGYFNIICGNATGVASSIVLSYVKSIPEPVFTGIIATGDYKAEYKYGDEFDEEGLKIYGTYTHGGDQLLDSGYVIKDIDSNQLGTQDVEISYEFNSKVYKTGFEIEILNYIKSIEAVGTFKTQYDEGEDFNPAGLKVKLYYADGSTDIVSGGFKINVPEELVKGTNTIEITYEGLTSSFEIQVGKDSILDMLGCFGSVTASAGIISLASFLGTGLLLLKKKEH